MSPHSRHVFSCFGRYLLGKMCNCRRPAKAFLVNIVIHLLFVKIIVMNWCFLRVKSKNNANLINLCIFNSHNDLYICIMIFLNYCEIFCIIKVSPLIFLLRPQTLAVALSPVPGSSDKNIESVRFSELFLTTLTIVWWIPRSTS